MKPSTTIRGGRRRISKGEYKRHVHQQIKSGLGNGPDGNWSPHAGHKASSMCQNGSQT